MVVIHSGVPLHAVEELEHIVCLKICRESNGPYESRAAQPSA